MDLSAPEYALLWADVTEFTQAMEARELDMGRRTFDWVDGCVSGWLPKLEGLFLQQAGDAVLLAFKKASLALQAAQRLQRDWARLSPKTRIPDTHELRIGLHWGRVMQGQHGYVSHSLNQLARLSQHVHAGNIWCSEAFFARLPQEQQHGYVDLGLMHFRHLEQPMRVFQTPSSHPAALARSHSPERPAIRLLVGSERDRHADAWAQSWLARLRDLSVVSVSELIADVPANASQVGALLRQAHADFLLLRRTLSVPQPTMELLAGPWGMPIQTWDNAGTNTPYLTSDELTLEVKDALWAHVSAAAKSQPEPALSHGLLQGAALHMMHVGKLQDFKRAGQLLAVWGERFKRHAQPHVWRVLWHIMCHTRGLGQVDATMVMAHAHEAIRLEPEDAHARAALGFATAHLLGDVECGLRHLEMAQVMAPELHWVPLYRSVLWCMLNRPELAMQSAHQALAQAPLAPWSGYVLGLAGHAAVFDHQPDLAVTWLESSWRQQRHASPTLRMLVVAHQMCGRHQLARFFLHELLSLEPGLNARSYLGRTRAGHARRAEMAHWLMQAGLPMK